MRFPTRKVPTRLAAFAFACMFALGGCGGSKNDALSATARARLTTLIEHVRSAADSGDRQAVQRALTELQAAVGNYESHGDIGTAKAMQILTAAAGVQSRLALIPTTTTTTSTPPTTAGGRGKGSDESKKHGKGGGD
jgi:hypothetical protein